MEFSIKLHAIKSGWSIVPIEGSQVIISKKKNVFHFLKIIIVLPNRADMMKCRMMRHFIWVFTVCKRTGLGLRQAIICIHFIKSELFSLAIKMDADRMVTIYLINVLVMV